MTECTHARRDEDLSGQLGAALRRFMQTETSSAGFLLAAAVAALLCANSPWSGLYERLWHNSLSLSLGSAELSMDLNHWVNDGLMVIFFFVLGLEVRREFAVGELTDRRRVVLPVIAGVGGMLVPALLYLVLNPAGEASGGWGIVIGTDTAFLLGMLALVGPTVSTQLRIFLITLTVIDDIVAVSVIGVVYTDEVRWLPLLVAVVSLTGIAMLAKFGVWRSSPYVLLVVVAWLATVGAGLHASIAGMIAGLLVPAVEPTRDRVEAAATRFAVFRQSPLPGLQRETHDYLTATISVNERLQESLHRVTGFVVVPIFAFANAGVDLRGGVLGEAFRSPVTWGVVVGLVLGKVVGISVGALGGSRLRLGRLPSGVRGGHIFGGAALSGIGFTMSLLIIGLAFDDQVLQRNATVGVLLSLVAASIAGWAVFAFAARFLGHRDAALPKILSESVDPARDHIRGPGDAEVTLVEYLDYECPFCARTTGAAAQIREHFGDRLRYVARHLPLEVHPHAHLAAVAAEAAGRQGKFWEMHDHLFTHQDQLELDDLAEHADGLGLDVEQFHRDIQDSALADHVRQDMASAGNSGVRSIPTFFVGDHRHVGRYDARTLIDALEALAAGGTSTRGTRTRR